MLSFPSSPVLDQIYPDPHVDGLPSWQWDGEKWKGSVASPGIPEGPDDGRTYGRKNEDWNAVLPIDGGTLAGALQVNGTINAPELVAGSIGLRTPDGGPNAFAFHWNGSAFYVNIDNATGWRHIPFDARIWEVARYVVTHENPGINSLANATRGVQAGCWNQSFNGATEAFNGGILCALHLASAGTCGCFRRVQYHIPNLGWVDCWFA